MRAEQLIAHRGYAGRYPENTMIAVEAAIKAGAHAVEIDVQFTRDGVPVLLHDPTFKRTAGIDRPIAECSLEEARAMDVCERARFGGNYSPTRISTLREFADAIARHPHVHAFVEVKKHAIGRMDMAAMVDRVVDALGDARVQSTVISFVEDMILRAREEGAPRIGLILREWSHATRQALDEIRPEVVFCDHGLLPVDGSRLWPGRWKWAMYEVTSIEHAEALLARGADLIETMHIGEMMGAIESRDRAPIGDGS